MLFFVGFVLYLIALHKASMAVVQYVIGKYFNAISNAVILNSLFYFNKQQWMGS
jgi:hypothetical protein